MDIPELTTRFWMKEGESPSLVTLSQSWWTRVKTWLQWIISDIDVETAPLALVTLLGWQRDIDRFPSEPERLFRLRVKFALANAKDSGCKSGFERIWERLGLGDIKQYERFDAENWDVIRLQIDEGIFGEYYWLLDELIQRYGRTCRRYELVSSAPVPVCLRLFDFTYASENCRAGIDTGTAGAVFNTRSFCFNYASENCRAAIVLETPTAVLSARSFSFNFEASNNTAVYDT